MPGAEALVEELHRRGVELVAAGDRLRYRPADLVPGELLEKMRAHKLEILEMLRRSSAAVGDCLGGAQPDEGPRLDADRVAAMPLEEFAAAGLVVRVLSEALGEEVIFASDNARIPPALERELVVYRCRELRVLLALEAPDLQKIHRTKQVFGEEVLA